MKVMTPLLGTKNRSAPVGDKSRGDRRAARSLLSCSLWRGMGRLWRGMGGIGRPEPLSAHHPHQQQGLSGFHETRDPRQGVSLARRESQREFQGFHETRNTVLTAIRFAVDAQGTHNQKPPPGPPCTPPGRCFPASCGEAWGGYGAACATRAAASLFTIVHHCSRLLTIVQQKILRLSQCPLSVLTGNAAGKVFTNHETRDKNHGLYAFHQTRDTNHGIFAARSRLPCPTFPTISRYFPAFPGKKIASAKHETRLLCFSRITKHESRTLLPPDYDFLPIHNASISHYPQEFFGILRIPHKPLSARCPPFSLGFPARAVRRSFRPAGSFRCGQHRMNPC